MRLDCVIATIQGLSPSCKFTATTTNFFISSCNDQHVSEVLGSDSLYHTCTSLVEWPSIMQLGIAIDQVLS